MKIKKYLNQPFPSPRHTWYIDIFYYSLFVSLFLFIFNPIDNDVPNKLIILAGFGLVAYITGSVLHLFFLNLLPHLFTNEKWTIKRHLVWFAVQLVFIGISNHIYSGYFIPFHPKGIEGLLLFEFRAFSLGVFPISVHIIITQNFLLSKNLKEAILLNNKLVVPINPTKTDEIIYITADNEKDFLEIRCSDLCLIESVGNYIQVYFIKNGKINNHILRCSLKKAEQIVGHIPYIFKCHRAFLVNIQYISLIRGNSQGYKLQIKNLEKEIPVARNYSKTLKEQLDILQTNVN